MKYTQALQTLAAHRASRAPSFRVLLAQGDTALHVQTLLAAHLQAGMPERKVSVSPGLFGDLSGTLERSDIEEFDGCALILEWSDLDPRLGFRRLGGWRPGSLDDIVAEAQARLARLRDRLDRLPRSVRVAISTPTLPVAPAFFQAGWEAGTHEWQLRESIHGFAAWASGRSHLHVVAPQYLDRMSPPAKRFDIKGTLLAGMPYTRTHAGCIADLLARLLAPPAVKKGLITDLDGTLWSGIVGEVGPEGVSWDLSGGGQIHGLYQQLLRSLAESGVLVGVASRNNPEVVQAAFERGGMPLPKKLVFPFEVHWGAKSGSVARILERWNIGADAVVVVDDSPLELAEIEAAHPGITCLPFPEGDPDGALELLLHLRDLFGRGRLSDEDLIRRESVRATHDFRATGSNGAGNPDDLLRQVDARVTFDFSTAATDPRAIELVNKTNQFNLNGARVTESEWHRSVQEPGGFVFSARYDDKFGPLGTISVVKGRVDGTTVLVDTWVMSCRAFARRVEHQCVRLLFEHFSAREVEFSFVPTERNEPIRDFFASVLGERPVGPVRITRDAYMEKCPDLFHDIRCVA